ncbi:hypothetical protein FRC00_004365, partial [Tulasnella sp. 408]
MFSPGYHHTEPTLPVGFTPWGEDSRGLDQDEALYWAMEEESKERNANAFSILMVLLSMLEDKTVEPYVKWLKTEQGDAFLIPDTEA